MAVLPAIVMPVTAAAIGLRNESAVGSVRRGSVMKASGKKLGAEIAITLTIAILIAVAAAELVAVRSLLFAA